MRRLLPLRVASCLVTLAVLRAVALWSCSFAYGLYAGRGSRPLTEDVEVLGVLRGRLVVGFNENLKAVHAYANGTRLDELKDNRWRMQDRRYGERDCRYAEYDIPPLPADIYVLGLGAGGRVEINATHFLTEDSVPLAAQWNHQHVVTVKKRKLMAASRRPKRSNPPTKPVPAHDENGRTLSRELRESHW
eukprot:TRINITY_DN107069_c0_g1_i1.p1 TRINITY_DN107069_c0_g1~~TRINITY_DN107069_c0_g1_i1.p1  ORF type:complete len:201 (-),score=32.63 TRINITY_DN107069_c0_g1_i1:74-643(-)